MNNTPRRFSLDGADKHVGEINISSFIQFFFNRASTAFLPNSPQITHLNQLIGGMENGTEDDYLVLNNESYYYVDNIDKNTKYGLDSSFQMTTVVPLEPKVNCTFEMGSIWTVFDEKYFRHSLGWMVTLVVAYMLILVIGAVGNVMVILVVARRPQMRTVTNIFIMNLAVADLFVIVFCVPPTLLANVFTPWILGSFMCKTVTYIQGTSVCASAYSLAAISLERCKAIFRPMERPRGLSKSQAIFTICLIWVVALLMTVPWAVIFNVTTSNKDGLSYCVETWEDPLHGKIYYIDANVIFYYCIPLVLISIANVSIWCHVSHRKVPQDSASANAIKKMHRQTRQGVRKMLSIVTLAFLLSWLPLYILVTRVKFSKHISEDESNVLEILMPLAQWLGSCNSSINPVLYAFLNSKFRQMFKSLMPTWVPLVHRNNANVIVRNNVSGGAILNGTFRGRVTQSYSNMARSGVVRSSSNNRRSRCSNRAHPSSPRTLGVNNFQCELPPESPKLRETKTVLVKEAATSTVLVLIDRNDGKPVPLIGDPSSKKATAVTDL